MKELAGKNAVITGAASGIGNATALALAERGVHLGLIDVDPAALAAAGAELAKSGVAVHCRALDVADRARVQRAASELEDQLGAIHILFSNAGVADQGGPVEETTDETFDWIMNVNVFGMFNVIKAFVPGMKRRGTPAHVLLTSSVVALHEQPGRPNGVYAGSKMAVLGFADGLRGSLPGHIGVSVLVPGMVATNLRRSGRYRPARFGGPFERPDAARPHQGMAPPDIARIIVSAIEEGEFLIVTHPEARELIVARYNEILGAYDRGSSRLERCLERDRPG